MFTVAWQHFKLMSLPGECASASAGFLTVTLTARSHKVCIAVLHIFAVWLPNSTSTDGHYVLLHKYINGSV